MFSMGKFKAKSYKICALFHPYLMDFFEISNSGRHHRDMKPLKTLASNYKHFIIYGTFSEWQIVCVSADILNTTFL